MGTIYGLVDPRNNETRYIGQTTRPLAKRLSGHYSKTAPRVHAWIAELRDAGLRPLIVSIREDVPVRDLRVAEHEEITRVIADGGKLLNEQATARGRALNSERRHAERRDAERAAWQEMATVALAAFGGPLPPGELPEVEIPDVSWNFMSWVQSTHREGMKSLIGIDYNVWRETRNWQDEATAALWHHTSGAWGRVRGLADDTFNGRMERYFALVAETPSKSRTDASRHLALTVWYMVAVDPWRHLAEIAGLPLDDASFIAWATQDADTRNALEFLASRQDGGLAMLAGDWERARLTWHEEGPGRLLATTAAAYSHTQPAEAIRAGVVRTLSRLGTDHQITSPMADLLADLDPKALDGAFGPDTATQIDRDLGLPDGTSGNVIKALADHLHLSAGDPVRRIADRASQRFPVVALPDYGGWSGACVPFARVVSASLVRAALTEAVGVSVKEYLADVRALWLPQHGTIGRREAA
jgi:hypothetical protein